MNRGASLLAAASVAGLALAAPAPAFAQQNVLAPPDYDTPAYCLQYASLTGVYVEALYGACLAEEAAAYEALAAIWRTLLRATIDHCYEISLMGGLGSYVIFGECIEAELETLATTPAYRP
ncbi:MAG: hypothetical protein KIT43_16070 [Bauldia sp.]|nr:hypothetical protein [Bauldia sp.]MCW5717427.1 hypothetical protein [Bauldia sp.]